MTATPRTKKVERAPGLKIEEIAGLVSGEIAGDRMLVITGAAGIKDAAPGDITFLSNPRYAQYLEQTAASAVLATKDVKSRTKTIVHVADPSAAFTKVLGLFSDRSESKPTIGVHDSAVIEEDVRLGENVHVGPHAVIEKHSVIRDGAMIEAGVYIGRHCVIGAGTRIYPNATIREGSRIGDRVIIHSGTVVGSDGFGYETVDGIHHKIPQTGYVQIDDDVEIGSNVSIDRGRFDRTWIGRGTKIDNLVQIAHNVTIGANSIVVSQTGISGSSTLGKNVVLAGQVGVVGHVEIGDNTIVGAQSGVTKSIPAGSIVLGSPAKPITEEKKLLVLLSRLPELFKEFAEFRKQKK